LSLLFHAKEPKVVRPTGASARLVIAFEVGQFWLDVYTAAGVFGEPLWVWMILFIAVPFASALS
jgi:hypothetical protein